MVSQPVRLARGAHDSAGKLIYTHFAFVSLAGIIRVSIAKVRLGAGLRGASKGCQRKFQANKKRAAAVG
jgi:hypothetical protein